MAYVLDIIGAAVLGGLVILLTVAVNLQITTSASESFNSTLTQRDAVVSSEILEFDLYKMGYRVSGAKIAIADSNEVKYHADLNNDGTADTIHYFLGTTSDMSSTMNPDDRPLYRALNSDAPYISSVVTDFEVAYLDAAGNQLDYDSLSSAVQRSNIRGIQTRLEFESSHPIDGDYQTVQLERLIRPKNL
jgi:hypothetical protein